MDTDRNTGECDVTKLLDPDERNGLIDEARKTGDNALKLFDDVLGWFRDHMAARDDEVAALRAELDEWREACIHAKQQRDRAILRVAQVTGETWHPDQEGTYRVE